MFSEMFCTKNNTHVNPLSQLSTILFLLYKKVIHKPYIRIKMEEGSGNSNSNEVEMGGCNDSNVSGVVGGSSRWNPTKEQISMLENLYKQGIKTPSAEEIQQITARLRVYGHIEGKNVFYWFQNHKARQRQKQKQETIAYFNRFLNHTTPNPFFSPPICTNGSSTSFLSLHSSFIFFFHLNIILFN